MISRAFKLRFRRRLRMRKLQVEEFGQQTERHFERNFFRRLERLTDVRRFVTTWILLLVLLGGCVVAQIEALRTHYLVPTPVPGGTYTEGILGSFTNANPLYATSPVDITVSKLLFASLLTYDEHNNLVGGLAKDWAVDQQGTLYTVHLKPNLSWHDGQPLTAADVAFTYHVIQNPDARSPLGTSWRGIEVKEVDPLTVSFKLPNPVSPFPYSLTNGIVPKHLLDKKAMNSLRTLPFNTISPIGAGPFKFNTLEVTGTAIEDREVRVAFDPFEKYYAGKPRLSRFVIHTFRTEQRLIKSYKEHDITAMAGLNKVPDELREDAGTRVYSLPLTAAVMTFFRIKEGSVLSDVTVRRALVGATDINTIIKSLDYPTLPVREPLLQNQLGYNAAYVQAGYNLATANALLESQGWIKGDDGVRRKDGQALTFALYVQDNGEYATIARLLQKQWRAVGVDVNVEAQDSAEFQDTLVGHTYDALLYGISIGKDPDVLVYWDSKHADVLAENRLNFSEYRSQVADEALQAGRTRLDPALRIIKYGPFLQAWRDDAPAVGLYQPRFLYITHGPVHGLSEHAINAEIERFTNVHNWMIREKGMSQAK